MANPSDTGPSGVGTEVIRRSYVSPVGTSEATVLAGVANHILTIISIIIQNGTGNSTDNTFQLYIDRDLSGTNVPLIDQSCNNKATFIWNDRFALTETDKLHIIGYGTSVEYHAWCTYIDQEFA